MQKLYMNRRRRQILSVLLDAQTPLLATQLAEQTQMHITTAHRILRRLEDAGWVSRDKTNWRRIPHTFTLVPHVHHHVRNIISNYGIDPPYVASKGRRDGEAVHSASCVEHALYSAISAKLAKERKALGIEQWAMAETLGVSQSSLCQAETSRQRVSMLLFVRLCRSMGLRPGEVLDELISQIDDTDAEASEFLGAPLFRAGIPHETSEGES